MKMVIIISPSCRSEPACLPFKIVMLLTMKNPYNEA